jgi:arylsulfatase A-like enzyme
MGPMTSMICASLLVAALPAGAAARSEGGSRGRPNLLLIISDDAGYADFGFQGSREIFTPRIDQLARGGVIFTNGYVAGAVCAPSRAGLMTGRYPGRFGYNQNNLGQSIPSPGFFEEDMGLPLFERTLADELRDLGYHTGLIGKWHLGDRRRDYHPQRRGFDDFYGLLGGWSYYFDRSRLDRPNRLMRGEGIVDDEGYVTDLLGQEALDYIEARHAREEPFFLTLAFTAPHSPLEATENDLKANADTVYAESAWGFSQEQRRTYAAMQTALDRNVGAVAQRLKRLGLFEDTLLIFINDNGGPGKDNASRNDPLRGKKGDSWEGGLRVPFFLSWPAQIEGGRRYDPVVSSLDLFPTFVVAAGGTPGENLDGVDLRPFLTGDGEGQPHPELYWPSDSRAAARSGRWKAHLGRGELYDLEADIGERRDVRSEHPDVYERLHAGWRVLNEGQTEPTRWWWSQWAVDQICDRGARTWECNAIEQVRAVFNNLTHSGLRTGVERINSFTLMDRALSRGVREDEETGTLTLDGTEGAAAVFRFRNLAGVPLDGVILTLACSPGAALEAFLDGRKVGELPAALSGAGVEDLTLELDLPRGSFRLRLEASEPGTAGRGIRSMTLTATNPGF